jgi:hypothetical protein
MTRIRTIRVMTFGRIAGTRPSRHLHCDQSLVSKMLQWLEAKWLPVHAGKMRRNKNNARDRTSIAMRLQYRRRDRRQFTKVD